MSKTIFIAAVIIFMIGLAGWIILSVFQQSDDSLETANPASVYCQEIGGTVELKGQIGICHLPDGRSCEEWPLYRENLCLPI